MATLSYRNINKIYDNNVQAVFDFNLEVADKEFIVFVGPSGCGKSTTLRMTAGLEHITSGELYIDDVLINNVESKDRDIAMVFQNYALYPHMTVARNMAFALEIKKMPKDEINKRVEEAAKILGLTEYLQRKPKALSGGQRQRVALGRAIVRKPKVFLMDEPLSNLDAKLRVLMRTEIKRIHEQVGATTIYVTHDQTEAMTMADRIVVMKDGYVQQIGTPTEVYNNPSNVFVAGFIGSPSMNFINCTLEGETVKIKDPNGEEGQSLKIGKEFAEKTYEAAKKEREELPELLTRYEGLLTKVTEEMEKTKGKRKKKKAYDLDSLNKDIEEIKARMVELDKYLEDKKSISIVLGVRPEHIYVDEDGNNKKPSTKVKAKVDVTELLGSELVIYSYLLGQKVIAKTNINNSSKVTNEVEYCFDLEQIRLFSALTGEAIK